ncbi:Mediator of RNA polymerase II transcription subunit 14 [Phlyctema vagabunda]|uniref:Mediator of RNA polymerase II transcription subunit 14 n=1 Tax=Phlyctema vagabunda TaxID=108571 RepID=A0ABR4P709_9HELO
MPGVIMDDRGGNGSHTNHERGARPNGLNGTIQNSDKAQEKGKGRQEPHQNMTPTSPGMPNGFNGPSADASSQRQTQGGANLNPGIDELPPEIVHLTEGYIPLSRVLTRLAQTTHNTLTSKILELAQMQVPTSAVNGGPSAVTMAEGNSVENVQKKLRLLGFAQDAHADWTKVLVLTEWSRKAVDVSKIIDLRLFLQGQNHAYVNAIDEMSFLKRDLAQARIPNPNLKTALEVLSTGKASWMPELGYIGQPPLTPQELLKGLENLNTLLSIRLNLHEHDKIPLPFKDYAIGSGRVTFSVAGEFEVDLTIADEDPAAQFWFIDFRFLFTPSRSDFTPNLRLHIENKVNDTLLKDGLPGCYKYLHELVLTHKISEFRRQAVELARGRWIDGLKVEPLDRALCIQYWLDRYGRDGPKSWILIGVHSGRRKDGVVDRQAKSRLFIRWFRESKEVKDVKIAFDDVNITVESLLKAVVAKHINHILTSTFDRLIAKPLFANHEAAISLRTSESEPMESELKIQLTNKEHATLTIEPISGRVTCSPASRLTFEFERVLNAKSRDPAKDMEEHIANLRCQAVADDVTSRALSVGWLMPRPPALHRESLKEVIPRNTVDAIRHTRWFKRPGWSPEWFVAVTLGVSGDHWWLMRIASNPPAAKLVHASHIDIKGTWASEPSFSFLSTLHVFAAALISQYTNLKALHEQRKSYKLIENKRALSTRIPAILLRLNELVPVQENNRRRNKWARNLIKLAFQGLEVKKLENDASQSSNEGRNTDETGQLVQNAGGDNEIMVTEARMVILNTGNLSILKERVDRDIAFHAESGSFAFRLRSKIGEAVISALVQRLSQVERLVDFVGAVGDHGKTLHCEGISLGKIIFTYGNTAQAPGSAESMEIDTPTNPYRAVVDFSASQDSMTIALERKNPHIRILDQLSMILNSSSGLHGVANTLHLTLPTLCGLDKIETAWEELSEKGEAHVSVRSALWFVLRYTLNAVGTVEARTLSFEVKVKERRGEPWWFIRRTDVHGEEDDIDRQLKSVWDATGKGWNGLRVSAAALPSGIEECLLSVDEVIRKGGTNDPVPEVKLPAVPAPKAPVAQMMPQAQMQRQPSNQQNKPQRPQSASNSSQAQGRGPLNPNQVPGRPMPNQNQARRTAQAREIVEID